jgi:4-oxalocrotonate tautomerase
MPHITVRMFAGRSEEEKARLAEAITRTFQETLGSTFESLSVGIEDVPQDAWMDQVYGPEIAGKADRLYKRPGYGPAKEG